MVRWGPGTAACNQSTRTWRAPSPRAQRLRWLAACVAAALPMAAAHAAMSFCAAPGLQTSERTNAAPDIEALIRRVDARLDAQPRPLPSLHTEGTLPHEGLRDASLEAEQDLVLMRDAALVWRATGDDRYLKLVDRFLFAWATTYRPNFDPIDETHFDAMILAYDLTASALSVKTRNATAAFLTTLGRGYAERIEAQPRPLAATFHNNWQSHRVKLVAMAAFTLDDRKLIEFAQQSFIEQIGNNIGPDGATLDFAQRDALRYVTYDLQPLIVAALSARRHNRNWLALRAANGASLAAALDWLVPYALSEKTHDEFVHSTVPFDAKRRDAGVEGYAGPWDPKSAAELFHLAARLSGRYAPVALRIAPAPPAWVAVCLPLAAR